MTAAVTGAKDIDRKLESMKRGARNAVLRPALKKAARESAKIVKSKIPSRYKDVRRSVGTRTVKMSKTNGDVVVKVGASVGKKMVDQKKQRTRPGVGISARNVHWWFFGTKERKINTGPRTGQSTGKMPIMEHPVIAILTPYASRLKAIITDSVRAQLLKLAAKGTP